MDHPHACLTFSEAATWGSAERSEITNIDVLDADDGIPELLNTDDEFESDDDRVVQGGTIAAAEEHPESDGGQDAQTERCDSVPEGTKTPDVDQGEDDACEHGPEVPARR